MQFALQRLGYFDGHVDGISDADTWPRSAVTKAKPFRPATGKLTADQAAQLQAGR